MLSSIKIDVDTNDTPVIIIKQHDYSDDLRDKSLRSFLNKLGFSRGNPHGGQKAKLEITYHGCTGSAVDKNAVDIFEIRPVAGSAHYDTFVFLKKENFGEKSKGGGDTIATSFICNHELVDKIQSYDDPHQSPPMFYRIRFKNGNIKDFDYNTNDNDTVKEMNRYLTEGGIGYKTT